MYRLYVYMSKVFKYVSMLKYKINVKSMNLFITVRVTSLR